MVPTQWEQLNIQHGEDWVRKQRREILTEAFTPPRRILRNEADLDAWVAEVRTSVIEKLSNGPVQI